MHPARTSTHIGRTLATLVLGAVFASCGDSAGPGVAVMLNLYSVDGVLIPAPLRSPRGAASTVGRGFLQGTNWGHACGFSVGLAEGPLTSIEIPSCRLKPGEARVFTVTFTDSRFPAGSHEYRFVP